MKKIVLLAFVLVLLSTTVFVGFRRPVKAESGTIYIKGDGSIDPPTANITSVDNVTYTFTSNISDFIVIERDNIRVDGNGYTLDGPGVPPILFVDGYGFHLCGVTNVTIQNAKIKDFWYGIYLNSSYNNIISSNIITNNGYGVMLDSSSNNTLSGNVIKDDMNIRVGSGILLGRSSNNNVSGNNIKNNDIGIWLQYSSNNNSIFGNNITKNNWFGICLESSSNNKIYHNNFENVYQVSISSDSVNVWDDGYPSGGNYWSDYTDVDQYSGPYQNETGSDGIWDHPYTINENNQDNYPIVPELPACISMLLTLIVLTAAITIYKRRLLKTSIH